MKIIVINSFKKSISIFIYSKLPSIGNLQSAKNTQTEDSPKESKDGQSDSEAILKQHDKLWSQAKIKSLGRKFNLDLAPKVSKKVVIDFY